MKFNTLQYSQIDDNYSDLYLSAQALSVNSEYEEIKNEYVSKFELPNVKSFSFTKDGFFAMFMQINGEIAVSLGESEAIVAGAKLAQKNGKNIKFLELNEDGSINLTLVGKSIDFIFISSYVTDTYFKIDLEEIKKLSGAKIVSNITANYNYDFSDILLMDGYKLTGQGEYGVVVYSDELDNSYLGGINLSALKFCLEAIKNRTLNKNMKYKFLEKFKEYFKKDLYLFVSPELCLDYTLHIGLKGIKARELIRTLSLHDIFLSNGEGCSLGLLKPSRIIQSMGYEEYQSRWSLSLDFCQEYSEDEIDKIIKLIYKKYRQIKALG